MPSTVSAGPLGSELWPKPTQVDCIEVTKVFDSCYQMQNFNNLCARVPHQDMCLQIAYNPASTATCAVTSTTCTLLSSVSTGVDDDYAVTFSVSLVETITLTGPTGQTCMIDIPVNFFASTTLCIPTGAAPTCTVASSCGPCVILPGSNPYPATDPPGDCHDRRDPTVCCQLNVCVVLQSTAQVQLLVPSYGYCAPAQCQVAAAPPCPAYPADCPTTSTTSGTSM